MENPGYDRDLSECVQRPDQIIDAGESAEDAADAGQRVGCDEDQAAERNERAARAGAGGPLASLTLPRAPTSRACRSTRCR